MRFQRTALEFRMNCHEPPPKIAVRRETACSFKYFPVPVINRYFTGSLMTIPSVQIFRENRRRNIRKNKRLIETGSGLCYLRNGKKFFHKFGIKLG